MEGRVSLRFIFADAHVKKKQKKERMPDLNDYGNAEERTKKLITLRSSSTVLILIFSRFNMNKMGCPIQI